MVNKNIIDSLIVNLEMKLIMKIINGRHSSSGNCFCQGAEYWFISKVRSNV